MYKVYNLLYMYSIYTPAVYNHMLISAFLRREVREQAQVQPQ